MILNYKVILCYGHKDLIIINIICCQALEKKSKIKSQVVFMDLCNYIGYYYCNIETSDENTDRRCYIIFIIILATAENKGSFIRIIITFLFYNLRKPSLCRNITFCVK